MRDKEDNIIYVGKAVSLRNRVRQYFRDDKKYPYIEINVKSDYPGVYYTRRIINDGSKYFGPYANPGAAKEMLDFIKERYKIHQCKVLKDRTRPCLNYHINRCLAPCMGNVNKEEYRKQINEIIDLLEGKTSKIIKEIQEQMKKAAEKMDYEKAAYLRDKLQAIERVSTKQKVSNISENNIDVIGLAKTELELCIEIFFVRGSKMIGREHYFYKDLKDMEDKEILSGFIKQYYFDNPNIPNKIIIKIEIYDISNISGEYMVAAMCVMQDGVIKKNLSRRFKIKTVYGQDDPKCMEEVITRRIKHSIEDVNGDRKRTLLL